MPFTLKMPKLSPTMDGGTIVKWNKKVGDKIKADDVLFEVATDKATVEYSAIDDGYLRKILVNEGGDALVNAPVAIFTETAAESIEGYVPEGLAPKKEAPKEASSSKSEEAAPKKEAPVASVGMASPAFTPEPVLEKYEFTWPDENLEGKIPASPLAKKLAKEKGLDLSTVKGSGPNQRVMSRDLDMAQGESVVAFGRREVPTEKPGSYTHEALTPMRKVIAERLQASKTFIPHFYVEQEISACSLVETREQLKAFDIKVSINDLVMRAVALALRESPAINSGFDSAKNAIIRFKTVDISVAVSIEGGLITPIVRHADYKNVGQISAEVKQLAGLAKTGKLKPEQYKGGSFSVSNLGMFGTDSFQAIINPPQAAILAVGGIVEKPIVRVGQIVPGKIMKVCLSVDHRVIDGAEAAKFLKLLKSYLESPAILLV